MILLLISLLAGVLTVLAPCTISLLPVIVGGSLSGERSKEGKEIKKIHAATCNNIITHFFVYQAAFIPPN